MESRRLASRSGILVALALLVGALGALAWAAFSVLPAWVVQADGHATITERGLTEVASSDWWFTVLGLVGGLIIGIAGWVMLREAGWSVALITAGSALLSGVTCWMMGEVLGPGNFADRIASAPPGATVPVALQLHSLSALAVWPFAAVAVPLLAASLGPDPESEAPRRRRGATTSAAAEADADRDATTPA